LLTAMIGKELFNSKQFNTCKERLIFYYFFSKANEKKSYQNVVLHD